MLIAVIGVTGLGRVTGLPVDDPAGLLRAVGSASADHILLLTPLHRAADAREQAHVLLAADPDARVGVLALPHHALTLALVGDEVLRRPDAADADPSTIWQLVRQSAARSRSLLWHPRLGGLADHARTPGQLVGDLGRAPGWFCELGPDSFTVVPGRRGARLAPGETVLHLGEAPALLKSQLGDVRAVPIMVEVAPAPYRSRRSVELTVLAPAVLPTTVLAPCASCGAGLVDQQCPFCGHGPVRRPVPLDAYRRAAAKPAAVTLPHEILPVPDVVTSGTAPVLVTTRGEAG